MWIAPRNGTVMQPTDISADLGASLLLLLLLAQLSLSEETASKPSKEGFGVEELLKTIESNVEQEEDVNRQVETLEHSSPETATNNNVKLQKIRAWGYDSNHLHKAVKTGNVAEVTGILDSWNVDLQSTYGDEKWTLLEWAVALGHKEVCQLLLERGANPQKFTRQRYFDWASLMDVQEIHWPLLLAARFGHLEIASLLVQYGARIPDKEPEEMAKERGYLKIAQFLCEWKGEGKCLYLA